MKRLSKSTLLVLVGALTAALLVASISVAANNASTSAKKKKKAVLTSKQKKSINKLIDAKIKQLAPGPAAYFAKNASASGDIPNSVNTISTTVLTKDLPAGKYAVTARVQLTSSADDASDYFSANCHAYSGATEVDRSDASWNGGFNFIGVYLGAANTNLNFSLDATAATTLSIKCAVGHSSVAVDQGASVGAGGARLTAIRVGSIG